MKRWVLAALLCAGCSIKHFALESLANGMSGTGGSFASDDDPELVRDGANICVASKQKAEPADYGCHAHHYHRLS